MIGSLNGRGTYTDIVYKRVYIERLAVNRLCTVVPLIDCFCHLATVKGFAAIVPFNYGLNYPSRSPVFPRLVFVPANRHERVARNFKTIFPVDHGSLRGIMSRNTRR